MIPAARLSPEAQSLLDYYPLPNLDAGGRFNYQAPVLATRHQDAGQARFSQSLSGGRNQLRRHRMARIESPVVVVAEFRAQPGKVAEARAGAWIFISNSPVITAM